MDDKDGNTTASGSRPGLPSPQFDEHASAKAQPVTPIPKSMFTVLFERTGRLFANSSRSLALIVALGIATGALVGMALVKQPQASLARADEQGSIQKEVEIPQDLQLQEAAEIGVNGIQNSAGIRRTVTRRSRVQSSGQPRAYRFGVIR